MSFGYQNLVYLLWVPFIIAFLLFYRVKKESRLRGKYFSLRLTRRLFCGVKKERTYASVFLKSGALFLLFIALLLPRYGYKTVEVHRKGIDILLMLDVSRSMLAEDVSPNRLLRAKYKIIDLLGMLQGDRIGLMIFAGIPFVQSPLTLDYTAIRMYLDDISADIIPQQGTGLTKALRKGAEVFDDTRPTSKAIILFSDGEDTTENPLSVAEELKDRGIRVYSVGVGSKEGAPIPDSHGGFKKDRSGKVVISSLHDVQLKNIAEITGGKYIAVTGDDRDLQEIYKGRIKEDLQAEDIQESKKKVWNERYQWFGFAAFLLLLLDSFISRNPNRNGNRSMKSGKIKEGK